MGTPDIETLCFKLAKVDNINWYTLALLLLEGVRRSPDKGCVSATWIASTLANHNVARLNPTRLKARLLSDHRVACERNGFRLKDAAAVEVSGLCPEVFGNALAQVDQAHGYLPQAVWKNTRSYIENICAELNGCVEHQYYNAAAVLVRRLVETLVIEAFISQDRQAEVQDSGGNYFMLSKLVAAATQPPGLHLGRDAKRALTQVKELGDRAAHNPRFNATGGDLGKIESEVRVLVDELLALANLRRSS